MTVAKIFTSSIILKIFTLYVFHPRVIILNKGVNCSHDVLKNLLAEKVQSA